MSFSDFDIIRRPRKENFFNQINHLIDWESIGQAIVHHYALPRTPQSCSLQSGSDCEDRDDETDAQTAMCVNEVTQPGVNVKARWIKKDGQSVFGYK